MKKRSLAPSFTVALALAVGCAPTDDALDQAAQALTGPAPVPPSSQGIAGPMGSNRWSSGSGGNTWSELTLADIDGNGFDDLCGRYGDSWGCATRRAGTFFEGFVEAGAVVGFARSTVRLADLDGDGRADVCGRGAAGYACLRSQGGSFGAPFTYVADMRSANGWGAPQYESTVMLGRLEGNLGGLDVCARGIAGVLCHFYVGAGTAMVRGPTAPAFSDANGWNQPQYYSTLALVDVTGDGRADVCGRGTDGVWCAAYDHLTRAFRPATLWTRQFADRDGWADARYYRSIRFGDVNGDGVADVCGRGYNGVYCGLSDGRGTFLSATSVAVPEFTNAAGFDAAPYPSTLTLVDYDGDGRRDVCMVGPHRFTTASGATGVRHELYCARSRALFLAFDPGARRTDLSGIRDVVAAGRIRAGSRGFCWVDVTAVDVRCTNAW